MSRSENDNYTFSASTEEFSLGEVAAPIIAFGDTNAGTVPKNLMVYFFGKSSLRVGMWCLWAVVNKSTENERLPEELGWSKKTDAITLQTILGATSIVRNATNLLTGGEAEAAPADPHKRRNLHSGMF